MTQKQHYVPAAVLANFSFSMKKQRRKSPIYVFRKGVEEPFIKSVADVCFVDDLYTIKDNPNKNDPDFMEKMWQGFERDLPQAIAELQNSPKSLSAQVWVETLVPYAASALVRTPEFTERFQLRFGSLEVDMGPDNLTLARLTELQRFMAPVMAASWTALRSPAEMDFIANDLGWCAIRLDGRNAPGFVIPVDRKLAIMITPRIKRTIMTDRGYNWIASGIEDRILTVSETEETNRCIAEWAREEIFGADVEQLTSFRESLYRQSWFAETTHLGFASGSVLIPTEFDWLRVATIARYRPGNVPFAPPDLPIKYLGNLAFKPMILIPTNLPGRVSGLVLDSHSVSLHLFFDAFFVAPDGMSSYQKLLHTSLLDALVSVYGVTRFRDIQQRFAKLSSDWGPRSTKIAEEIRLSELKLLTKLLAATVSRNDRIDGMNIFTDAELKP